MHLSSMNMNFELRQARKKESYHVAAISNSISLNLTTIGAGVLEVPRQVTLEIGLLLWSFWISPFSSSEPTILLACGRNQELWEQPFWNNKGNSRILPIRFHAIFIYGTCLKWLLPELSIPAAGQKDLTLWGRGMELVALFLLLRMLLRKGDLFVMTYIPYQTSELLILRKIISSMISLGSAIHFLDLFQDVSRTVC